MEINRLFISISIVALIGVLGVTIISCAQNDYIDKMNNEMACDRMTADGYPVRDSNHCMFCEVDYDKDGWTQSTVCSNFLHGKFGPSWYHYWDNNITLVN